MNEFNYAKLAKFSSRRSSPFVGTVFLNHSNEFVSKLRVI